MIHTENDKHTEMEGRERKSERERERKCVGSADVFLLFRLREYVCENTGYKSERESACVWVQV